jgi:glyoxylase-like metal-dependent hydrolase (beta-lactamase superfamily II)
MITIGDFRIQRIEEFVADEPASLYAEWSEEVLERHCDLLVPTFFDPAAACFRPHIQCWLVQTPTRNILIDTCSGNQKPRPASPRFHMLDLPWLERLRALGVTAEQIDTVICTHLHVDHVGWNTRLIDGAWVPTFPNARYVFPRIEVEWRDPERGAAGHASRGP